MMKLNMAQWVQDTIADTRKKPLPILSFPAVQQMGITVRQLVMDSGLQAKGMKLMADTFDTAAAVGYMDLSVEAEAFGAEVHYADQEVPTVVGACVASLEDAEALSVPPVGAGRTGICLEAVRKAAAMITDRPVFAGVIGPFSLAGRLLDVSEALCDCYDEPELVHAVLEKATEFLTAFCRAYRDAGANGVILAEPLAGLLSQELAEEFSAAYVRRIVEAVQNDTFLVVYHNCGNSVVRTMDTIVSNGCRLFHFGNAVDMEAVMPHIPGDCIAMGNVDPAAQFRRGTPESVYAATMDVMKRCAAYPNFLISSGCDIPPQTAETNIRAFFQAAADFQHSGATGG